MNSRTKSDQSPAPHIMLVLTSAEIESRSIERPLAILQDLSSTKATALAHAGTLSLAFEGCGPVEKVHERPEVCDYVRAIHARWPYWFFFANRRDHTVQTLQACILCPGVGSSEKISFDPQATFELVMHCQTAMVRLCAELKLTKDERNDVVRGFLVERLQEAKLL